MAKAKKSYEPKVPQFGTGGFTGGYISGDFNITDVFETKDALDPEVLAEKKDALEKALSSKVEPKPSPIDDPVFIATCTCKYRFRCDGTLLQLVEGVSPLELTEARLNELKRYHRVKEVK